LRRAGEPSGIARPLSTNTRGSRDQLFSSLWSR
jgi:hypothetical protein